MGHIKLDELSTSLKDYITNLGLTEEQVNELIQNVTGDMSTLQTTEKTVAGAINELFQNANNGKELIATAIGEPLTAEDTFSAMSNGIDGLTTSFKTALMNNGVSVGSTDKFKQLIEKIALLADSEGKGIKYASGLTGEFDLTTIDNTNPINKTINLNLDFVPDLLFVGRLSTDFYNTNNRGVIGSHISNLTPLSGTSNTTLLGAQYLEITNLSKDSFDFSLHGSTSVSSNKFSKLSTFADTTWYAIGVGEEDTTLEDTLREILINKGVNLTGEETLIDLILKVDEIKTNGRLNIITATELPDTVTEDQIVVITTESVNEFILNPKKPTLSIGQVYIQTDFSTASLPKYEQIITGGDNITLSLYLSTTVIMTDRGEIKADAYIGKNGEWKSFSTASLIVWNSYFDNYNLSSNNGWVIINKEEYGPNLNVSVNDNQLIINNSGYFNGDVFTKQPIDFTDATTLEIEMPKITAKRTVSADYGLSAYVYIADSNSGTFNDINKVEIYRFVGYNTTTLVEPGVITYDVSSMSGLKYLVFELGGNGSTNGTMYINRIELLK